MYYYLSVVMTHYMPASLLPALLYTPAVDGIVAAVPAALMILLRGKVQGGIEWAAVVPPLVPLLHGDAYTLHYL